MNVPNDGTPLPVRLCACGCSTPVRWFYQSATDSWKARAFYGNHAATRPGPNAILHIRQKSRGHDHMQRMREARTKKALHLSTLQKAGIYADSPAEANLMRRVLVACPHCKRKPHPGRKCLPHLRKIRLAKILRQARRAARDISFQHPELFDDFVPTPIPVVEPTPHVKLPLSAVLDAIPSKSTVPAPLPPPLPKPVTYSPARRRRQLVALQNRSHGNT